MELGGAASTPQPGESMSRSPSRSFQHEASAGSLAALESALREYIRTVPFRPIPLYSKIPPPKKRAPAPPLDVNPNVYSHSALQRYLLQELAVQLHGPDESHRDHYDIQLFQKVLTSPSAAELEKINPHVRDLPKTEELRVDTTSLRQTPVLSPSLPNPSFFRETGTAPPSFAGLPPRITTPGSESRTPPGFDASTSFRSEGIDSMELRTSAYTLPARNVRTLQIDPPKSVLDPYFFETTHHTDCLVADFRGTAERTE